MAPFVRWNTQIAAGTSSGTAFQVNQYTAPIGGLTTSNFGYFVAQQTGDAKAMAAGMVQYESTSGLRTIKLTVTPTGSTHQLTSGICATSANVFIAHIDSSGPTFKLYRYSLSALASEQLMTMSGTTPATTATPYMFSDGTLIYIHTDVNADTYYVYSISGTTATRTTTLTFTGIGESLPWSDGVSVWAVVSGVVKKWAIAGGASSATGITLPTSLDTFGGIAGIGATSYLDAMWGDNGAGDLSVSSTGHVYLFLSNSPIGKP